MIEFQEEDGNAIDISNTSDWFSFKKEQPTNDPFAISGDVPISETFVAKNVR